MTSNAMDKQHRRGWRLLQSMPQGRTWGHGGCEIDEHRMIILGGCDDGNNVLSSGFIYDSRTQQLTPLPNDMPEARFGISAVANERYLFVIGGKDADWLEVNTLYRLSLVTYEWTTLTPIGTAQSGCAAVLLGDYFYIFGGSNGSAALASAERYSIVGNSWEDLPDMAAERSGYCAVAALRNVIYILGGGTCALEVFDTALQQWRTEARLCDMPELRRCGPAAVVLKNRYLVVIGGLDEDYVATAGCLIYDCSINQWNSTPASMNMITWRNFHTAAVLDGKIVVAGGRSGLGQELSSMECIDARDILEYAPLEYPLPDIYFSHILQLGKALLVTKYT